MRIYAVTPLHVGADELTRRQERYDRISPDGLHVELHDLPVGAPTSLECEQDMRTSERYVLEALSGAPDGFDALLADCVLDPAVARLQSRAMSTPVIGILRTNLAHAAALGCTTAAVVRNDAIADEMRAVAAAYGWSAQLTDVRTLDLDFDAIADGARWQAQLDHAAEDAARLGARTLLNGCSAVDTDADRPSPVPVYDPVARALRLVAAGAAR